MNKTELAQVVAERMDLSKRAAVEVVETVFQVISESLSKGERVQLIGFGNFELRERSARKGRNPQTGEVIDIAASRIPAFRAGKTLRQGIR